MPDEGKSPTVEASIQLAWKSPLTYFLGYNLGTISNLGGSPEARDRHAHTDSHIIFSVPPNYIPT